MAVRPQARNLIEEASAKRQKTLRQESWPLPPPPSPDTMARINSLSATTGQNYMEMTNAVAIQVSDDISQDAIDSEDVNFQKDLSVLPGFYWKIGHNKDQWPVFRQEPSDGINSEELFMHHIMYEGWFISTTLFTSYKGLDDTSGIIAWGAAVTGSFRYIFKIYL